jgi:hypothetical protein
MWRNVTELATIQRAIMRKRNISFEQAKLQYPNRFTLEHVPANAGVPIPRTGLYRAPAYVSDIEWYENTFFPLEGRLGYREDYARSCNESWPLGQYLQHPFTKGNVYVQQAKEGGRYVAN